MARKKGEQKFMYGIPREAVIEENLGLCGYFVIITSEKMTALEALLLYKSRDDSEKLFRGDKTYLGNRSNRTYSSESFRSKIFIEFAALIVRNKIYTSLVEKMKEDGKKNYMTVPAAIRELEKIEMLKGADNEYNLDYAVTATQKTILKAFDMTAENIHRQARALSSELMRIETEAFEKQVAARAEGGA